MSLTKFKQGSLRELWSISFPLMLSSLSVTAMLFVDRIFLSKYSTEAFTAVVSASTVGWAFIIGWLVLTSIGEVFVAQHHGANENEKIGIPVWQMIWASVGSLFFFLPLGFFGGYFFSISEYLILGTSSDHTLEMQYFFWMMCFSASFPLYGALSGFFIGQGKVHIITILALSANLVNALLDWVLIFGIEGIIPSYGISGAAIATCSSELFQAGVLLCLFLSRKNRKRYRTDQYQINFSVLSQCLKIGAPAAVFVTVEILAWGFYYTMLTWTSEKHIIIAGICQSLLILLFFISEGIGKGITTIAGNLIGARQKDAIHQSIKAGIKLHLCFFVGMLGLFLLFPKGILYLFSSEQQLMDLYGDTIPYCVFMLMVYLFLEGIRYIYAGVLTAAGDTKFLLLTGSTTIWFLLIIPVYYIIVKGGGSVELAQTLCTFYALVIACINTIRYTMGKWKTLSITA
ncbi:MAG: MATE family efflux transporter [Chlamydiales bacterium]